jgi:hypothetical protein
MSTRIFADMQRSNVGRTFDRLPIIANSCNYPIRFVSQEIFKAYHDLRLCLLTMGLLNGEVPRYSRDIRMLPAEMNITNYMQYITFNKFDPPATKRRLSYLKACRLHQVSLRHYMGHQRYLATFSKAQLSSKESEVPPDWTQQFSTQSPFSVG